MSKIRDKNINFFARANAEHPTTEMLGLSLCRGLRAMERRPFTTTMGQSIKNFVHCKVLNIK
jgi:hypothetical protein